VTYTSNEKWQRYEQTLLTVLGFDQLPPSATASTYQLLIIPVFHAPCCLRLTLADQDGELSFALLVDRYADLFDAVWRERLPADVPAGCFVKRACLEDIVYLPALQAATLRQQLATMEPATLSDIDLAARDGVSLRCDCWEGSTPHTFSMRSPTAQAAPRHAALCQLFFETARAHIQHAQIQEYLAVLARSFHELIRPALEAS
jgi:hypothetical protein